MKLFCFYRISFIVQSFIRSFTNVSNLLQYNYLLSLTLSSLTLFVFRCWGMDWGPGVGLIEAMWRRSSLLWCVVSRWHYSYASWHWVCIITRVSDQKNPLLCSNLNPYLILLYKILMSYVHISKPEVCLPPKVKRKKTVFKDPVPLKNTLRTSTFIT